VDFNQEADNGGREWDGVLAFLFFAEIDYACINMIPNPNMVMKRSERRRSAPVEGVCFYLIRLALNFQLAPVQYEIDTMGVPAQTASLGKSFVVS
jgi:hypothetical protein